MQQGKYIECIDTTHSNLKHFQDFLYRNFKESENYDQMTLVLTDQIDSLQQQKVISLPH